MDYTFSINSIKLFDNWFEQFSIRWQIYWISFAVSSPLTISHWALFYICPRTKIKQKTNMVEIGCKIFIHGPTCEHMNTWMCLYILSPKTQSHSTIICSMNSGMIQEGKRFVRSHDKWIKFILLIIAKFFQKKCTVAIKSVL